MATFVCCICGQPGAALVVSETHGVVAICGTCAVLTAVKTHPRLVSLLRTKQDEER